MPEVRLVRIVSCSSEHASHPASNLLLPDSYRRWRGAADQQARELSVIVQFASSARINAVHIGNDGAAFVAVHVAKLARTTDTQQGLGAGVAPDPDNYHVLLPASSFMSPKEARVGAPTTRVRLFAEDKLDEHVRAQKWECAQIICTQPFNRTASYGLAFVKFFAESEVQAAEEPVTAGKDAGLGGWRLRQETDSEAGTLRPGGLFARNRNRLSTEEHTGGNSLVGRALKTPPDMAQPPRMLDSQLEQTAASASERLAAESRPRHSTTADSSDVKTSRSDGSARPSSDTVSQIRQYRQSHTPRSKHSDDLSQWKHSDSPSRSKNSDTPSRSKHSDIPSRSKQSDSPNRKTSASPPLSKKLPIAQTTQTNPSTIPKLKQNQDERKNPPRPAANNSDHSRRACRGPPTNARFAPTRSLLAGVTFTLSGYQNPRRSRLRDTALSLGARYSPDWSAQCTHVVCAFANTPKLARAGSSVRAVRGEWLEQCAAEKRRLPWRRFAVRSADGAAVDSDTDQLVWDESLRPLSSAQGDVTHDDVIDDDVDDDIEAVSDDDAEYTIGSDDGEETDTDDEIEAVRRSENSTKRPPRAKAAANRNSDVTAGGWLSSRADDREDTEHKNSKKRTSKESDSEVSHCRRKRARSDSELSDLDNRVPPVPDSVYEQSTDSDCSESASIDQVRVSSGPLPDLPDFFAGLTFFMHAASLEPETKRQAERFAVAFGGSVAPHCGKNVNYIVTSVPEWSSSLDELMVSSERAVAVRPSWLFECNSRQCLAPAHEHTMSKLC